MKSYPVRFSKALCSKKFSNVWMFLSQSFQTYLPFIHSEILYMYSFSFAKSQLKHLEDKRASRKDGSVAFSAAHTFSSQGLLDSSFFREVELSFACTFSLQNEKRCTCFTQHSIFLNDLIMKVLLHHATSLYFIHRVYSYSFIKFMSCAHQFIRLCEAQIQNFFKFKRPCSL